MSTRARRVWVSAGYFDPKRLRYQHTNMPDGKKFRRAACYLNLFDCIRLVLLALAICCRQIRVNGVNLFARGLLAALKSSSRTWSGFRNWPKLTIQSKRCSVRRDVPLLTVMYRRVVWTILCRKWIWVILIHLTTLWGHRIRPLWPSGSLKNANGSVARNDSAQV